jgi:hypothetical protein
MTKEELIEKLKPLYPFKGNSVDEQPFITFGQYYTGVGDVWDWFDKDATFERDGIVQKRFVSPLRGKGHRFIQDASEEELQNLIDLIEKQHSAE